MRGRPPIAGPHPLHQLPGSPDTPPTLLPREPQRPGGGGFTAESPAAASSCLGPGGGAGGAGTGWGGPPPTHSLERVRGSRKRTPGVRGPGRAGRQWRRWVSIPEGSRSSPTGPPGSGQGPPGSEQGRPRPGLSPLLRPRSRQQIGPEPPPLGPRVPGPSPPPPPRADSRAPGPRAPRPSPPRPPPPATSRDVFPPEIPAPRPLPGGAGAPPRGRRAARDPRPPPPRSPTPGSASCPPPAPPPPPVLSARAPRRRRRRRQRGRGRPAPAPAPPPPRARGAWSSGLPPPPPLGPDPGSLSAGSGVLSGRGARRGGPAGGAPPESGFAGGTSLAAGWGPEPRARRVHPARPGPARRSLPGGGLHGAPARAGRVAGGGPRRKQDFPLPSPQLQSRQS